SALPSFVNTLDLFRAGDDLPASRKSWTFDGATQLAATQLPSFYQCVEEPYACLTHFVGIVWRDVSCHPDGDATSSIDEEIGNFRWQNDGFCFCSIVVGTKRNGVLPELFQ